MRPIRTSPAATRTHTPARVTPNPRATRPSLRRYSVLNDFRYLTAEDVELIRAATGEDAAESEPRSQFAQQIALDRRRGDLARDSLVTVSYLRGAATRLHTDNGDLRGFTNPYSGPAFEKALAYLGRLGRDR